MKIQGISASPGISICKVFILQNLIPRVERKEIQNASLEIEKYHSAVQKTLESIDLLKHKAKTHLDENNLSIFEAHKQIAEDIEIAKLVENKIATELVNVDFAYHEVIKTFIEMFEKMDNDYFKERVSDIKDVSNRVIANLQGLSLNNPLLITEEVIVVAHDLSPSETVQLPKKYIRGFITDVGGRTSHSAILARSLEIPAVVGTKNITDIVKESDTVIVDGISGIVIINPSQKEIDEYIRKKEDYKKNKLLWKQFSNKPTLTKDAHHVEIAANIGNLDDIESSKSNYAEGIGLFRSEFLYMNSNKFPSEDKQYNVYKTVLEQFPNKKVVIRTLDIGGDKELPYLTLEKELNPFLGHRAIRLCLEKTDMFKTQLKALLRAGVYGNLHIMFPMIATLEELTRAKELLSESKNELKQKKIPYSENVKVGIMVEIPSVAILADKFAKKVDFFSIGTNDLIQYTFAAGRMNSKVSYLYQPYNPSLLRLIKTVIDAAHKEKIWVGMCGEMAGDPMGSLILLGLGLDEFSMSSSSILETRYRFSLLEYTKLKNIAIRCLQMSSEQEVKKYMINSLDKQFNFRL
jgi:phosphotransferase system enzyme I (PtsI)